MKNQRPVLTVICGFHYGASVRWWQCRFPLSGDQLMGRVGGDTIPAIAIPKEVTTVSNVQGVFRTDSAGTYYQAAPKCVNDLYRGNYPLTHGEWHTLKNGDILGLYGDSTKEQYVDVFFVYSDGTSGNQLDIQIEERSVIEKASRKYLLKNVNLTIPGGHMVLILGGSGAGKTTFMNAVMGYEKAKGRILYNGKNIYQHFEEMKYEIGYVPQQDLLRLNDSVYQTLMDAAKMRLPANTSRSEYHNRVEQTMRMLGLKKEERTLVGKLSGGQRKRLSIAVEYIGNPSLFFLDEPDSGLDSSNSLELMKNLRAIADQGKIVLVISHSPNRVERLFDDVIALAKHTSDNCGHLAFYGNTQDAYTFFGVKTGDLEGIVQKINPKHEGGKGLGDHFIQKFAKGGSLS